MDFIFVLIVLIMSVVLHELAHGHAALSLGDRTAQYANRLTLNPISHLDPIGSVLVPLIGFLAGGIIIGWAKPVPYNPYNLSNQRWGEAYVAAAGPLTNLLIALIFGFIIRISVIQGFASETLLGLSSLIVFLNIILAIFNLIPIPPLDGSKVLFSILPYSWTEFRNTLEAYGFFAVLIFVFLLWGTIVYPIATYLFSIFTGLPFGAIGI